MAPRTKSLNPFYVLVVLSGVAFAITACSYGVMTVKQLDRGQAQQRRLTEDPFSQFMDKKGPPLMAVELVALALFTGLSISMDQYVTAVDEEEPVPDSRGEPQR